MFMLYGIYSPYNVGIPGPPTNFTASFLNNSLFLMWMPPFSSLWDVPILYYVIDVFDDQAFLLERANTSNLSYSFNYSVLGINRCFSSYGIRVNLYGISFDGEGNISTLFVSVTQNEYCITIYSNTTVSGNKWMASFNFNYISDKHRSYFNNNWINFDTGKLSVARLEKLKYAVNWAIM